MRFRLILCLLALTLSACSQSEEKPGDVVVERKDNSEQDKQIADEKKDKDDKDNKDNENNKKTDMKKDTEDKSKEKQSYENLTVNDIVAMAIKEDSISDVSITADDLLSGSFEHIGVGPTTSVHKIDRLLLNPVDYHDHPGLTKNQKIYAVSQRKINAVSIIIIDEETNEIVITVSQYPAPYEELREIGYVFNIKDLFEKHYDDDLEKISQKVVLADEMTYEDYSKEDIIALAWLTYHYNDETIDSIPIEPTTPYLTYSDKSNEPLNPYNKDSTVPLPEGTTVILGEVLADGQVTFIDNKDGTFTYYLVPSHFHDLRWLDDDNYSLNESKKIINEAKVLPILEVPYDILQNYSNIVKPSEY
ncbi:hypothetical protein [Nosocomiicoccus ampullae]|uniref:Uncharacterized protein n=1 Tax=Nosocomiicoccus ampullae TaxID=489910 RepID=A0A9Q2CZ66_9STAP|nr:hypothetical protein [Nosocomiicoccus ampullae]MBB5175622.1 hypothetical protein [Nosocomiicoccus ampullae]QYA47020.1 hypothetical protein KPF49_00760 [Nosocomiicoccus ampullae]